MTNGFVQEFSGTVDEGRSVAVGENPQPAKKSAVPNVLVVDDESLVRWTIAEKLGEHGFDVMEAVDAETAMCELVRTGNRTDLVMLDLRLPDSDDLGVLGLIRTLSPDMPVILMTAYGTPSIIQEAVRLGARVLDKPFDVEDLVPLVTHALAVRPGDSSCTRTSDIH
jgi:DNA-binding NtrC family response regulator